jgi:hypothetical protein
VNRPRTRRRCVPPGPNAAPALLLGLVLLSGAAGCASGGEGRARPGSSATVLEREEFADLAYTDAYEIVARLRPRWLRGRGFGTLQSQGSGLPVVYRDGRPLGGLELLRDIDFDAVERIEFIGASDSTTRFGTGHLGGVILVTTRRPERPPLAASPGPGTAGLPGAPAPPLAKSPG